MVGVPNELNHLKCNYTGYRSIIRNVTIEMKIYI
jgi:hypothetical protein